MLIELNHRLVVLNHILCPSTTALSAIYQPYSYTINSWLMNQHTGTGKYSRTSKPPSIPSNRLVTSTYTSTTHVCSSVIVLWRCVTRKYYARTTTTTTTNQRQQKQQNTQDTEESGGKKKKKTQNNIA